MNRWMEGGERGHVTMSGRGGGVNKHMNLIPCRLQVRHMLLVSAFMLMHLLASVAAHKSLRKA